jgi:hypothetical protein
MPVGLLFFFVYDRSTFGRFLAKASVTLRDAERTLVKDFSLFVFPLKRAAALFA